MTSAPFQIPGLVTLGQNENASGPSTSTHSASVTAGSAPVATSQEHDANPIESAAPEGQAARSDEHAITSDADANAMDVDHHGTQEVNKSIVDNNAPPSPPSLTEGLEALLGLNNQQQVQTGQENTEMQDAEHQSAQPQEHPEWEVDSSPYESSSDSSSSDDSDDSDDDSEDGKTLLNPEEMARILMETASDDEGDGRAKGSASGAQLRTKNEIPEDVLPKPDVTITPEMEIRPLGEIEFIVENAIVIKAYTSGEYEVLDSGSVLCTENRSVIAALADLIGSVREPRYMARFIDEEEIKSFNLALGTKIYYPPEHANRVFTEPLKSMKGTDASNLNDEELGEDEMEFSDDEKEAEYKRGKKEKRKARQMARGGAEGPREGRGGAPVSKLEPGSLNYDEEDDGPYRPLTRPANFGQGPTTFTHGSPETDDGTNRRGGRGDFRGRGRGRRDDRGGRGSRGDRRGGSGYSQTSGGQSYAQQPQQQPFPYPVPPPQFGAAQGYPVPPPPQFASAAGAQAFNPQFPFPAWPQPPQNLPAGYVPPPPPQFQQQGQGVQPGSYYNAAFLAGLQNQYQGQNQQGGQWPHQGSSG